MFVRTRWRNSVYRPVTQRFFLLSTESHCGETGRHADSKKDPVVEQSSVLIIYSENAHHNRSMELVE